MKKLFLLSTLITILLLSCQESNLAGDDPTDPQFKPGETKLVLDTGQYAFQRVTDEETTTVYVNLKNLNFDLKEITYDSILLRHSKGKYLVIGNELHIKSVTTQTPESGTLWMRDSLYSNNMIQLLADSTLNLAEIDENGDTTWFNVIKTLVNPDLEYIFGKVRKDTVIEEIHVTIKLPPGPYEYINPFDSQYTKVVGINDSIFNIKSYLNGQKELETWASHTLTEDSTKIILFNASFRDISNNIEYFEIPNDTTLIRNITYRSFEILEISPNGDSIWEYFQNNFFPDTTTVIDTTVIDTIIDTVPPVITYKLPSAPYTAKDSSGGVNTVQNLIIADDIYVRAIYSGTIALRDYRGVHQISEDSTKLYLINTEFRDLTISDVYHEIPDDTVSIRNITHKSFEITQYDILAKKFIWLEFRNLDSIDTFIDTTVQDTTIDTTGIDPAILGSKTYFKSGFYFTYDSSGSFPTKISFGLIDSAYSMYTLAGDKILSESQGKYHGYTGGFINLIQWKTKDIFSGNVFMDTIVDTIHAAIIHNDTSFSIISGIDTVAGDTSWNLFTKYNGADLYVDPNPIPDSTDSSGLRNGVYETRDTTILQRDTTIEVNSYSIDNPDFMLNKFVNDVPMSDQKGKFTVANGMITFTGVEIRTLLGGYQWGAALDESIPIQNITTTSFEILEINPASGDTTVVLFTRQ